MTRKSVVLPAPLEPIRPVNSPGMMRKRTSSRIRRPESETPTPSTLRMGSAALGSGW